MPVALAACMLALLLQTPAPRQAPPPLRFHHVHVRVGDPASSSRDASVRLNGTRTILQGHGLSVRAGREYVVFARDDEVQQQCHTGPLGFRDLAECDVSDNCRPKVAQ